MPTYEVSSPDGTKYRVNAPEGATQEDAISYVQKNFTAPKHVDMPAPSKGFGQQLGDAIADVPHQIGLTARHGIEGLTSALGTLASPIRAGMNMIPGVNIASGEDAGKGLADALHLPTPRTSMERIVAEPTKMMAGGMGLLGAARVASSVPGMVGKVAGLLAENPVQQLQSAAGAGTAGGYVKETGGGAGAQLAAGIAGGVAAPIGISALKGLPQMAKSAVEYLAPGLAKPQDFTQVDVVIGNLLADKGMKIGDLTASVRNQLRDDVASAMKTSGEMNPDAMRRLADYRMTGATPTRATLTLDPADISRQKNTAKFGINSSDPKLQQLGQVENANNKTIIQGLNDLGAGAWGDAISGGQRVMGRLGAMNSRAQSGIDAAYEAARGTGGRSVNLDPSAFTQKANNLLDEALLGGKLPSDVRNLLNKAATGEMPLTVDVAEQFKTRIGDLQRATNDRAEKMALGLVRQALDDTPVISNGAVGGQLGQASIDAFNKARGLNRDWMRVVEKVPALQAVRDGIEPDKFVNDFIIGNGSKASVMDVAKLKTLIKDSPDAMQAVREQLANHFKSKALGGAADEVGSVSQSNLNKAMQFIGERKLRLFFDNNELEQMKALARVASYEQVQPRGSAVNNSNTAGAALATLFDKLANSPLLGKIPLAPQMAGNVSASIAARRALNAPGAIVNPAQSNSTPSYLLPMMAGSGLLSP